MKDESGDPLDDPALAELIASRLIKAADHAREIERPDDFDGIEAVGRFMALAQRIQLWWASRARSRCGRRCGTRPFTRKWCCRAPSSSATDTRRSGRATSGT